MRHFRVISMCFLGIATLAGCQKSGDQEVNRAFQDVNVVDESNLSDIMLTVADPNEAVNYFKRTVAENPDRADLHRGLGQSLIRAKRPTEAVPVYERL